MQDDAAAAENLHAAAQLQMYQDHAQYQAEEQAKHVEVKSKRAGYNATYACSISDVTSVLTPVLRRSELLTLHRVMILASDLEKGLFTVLNPVLGDDYGTILICRT